MCGHSDLSTGRGRLALAPPPGRALQVQSPHTHFPQQLLVVPTATVLLTEPRVRVLSCDALFPPVTLRIFGFPQERRGSEAGEDD